MVAHELGRHAVKNTGTGWGLLWLSELDRAPRRWQRCNTSRRTLGTNDPAGAESSRSSQAPAAFPTAAAVQGYPPVDVLVTAANRPELQWDTRGGAWR